MNEFLYKVSFLWRKTQTIVITSPDVPENELAAEAIAYGGIKLWFEKQGLPVPPFVSHVRYVDTDKIPYEWEVLPLKN